MESSILQKDQIIKYVSKTANLGKNVKIWHFAYVGDNTIIGNNVIIAPGATFTNDPYPMSPKMIGVTVEDGAIIAARAVIKPGVTIGKNAVVGMGAVVTKDVPSETVVIGNPAKIKYTRKEYDEKKTNWEEAVS